MAKIIGIDLGTTNSEAACMEGGAPKIIPSAEGSAYGGKMFPSVVAFTKDGILVGEPAKRQAVLNPDKTVMQIKRKMGTDYKVRVEGKDYAPQEISAMVLRKIKADAEAFLGQKISQVVITVPAYFNDNQRQATKDAGKIAGLEVLRLVNEPTAAALAYGLDKKGEGKIAVLDLGGGTFDVTLMEMGDGVFEVVATSGDTQLGGMDMDNALIQWLVTEFQRDHGVDLSGDRQAMQRLRDAAEKAKIELSSTMETTLNLPFIAQKGGQPLHLEKKLTRSKLEQVVEPVLERVEGPIRQAFKDAKWQFSDVNHVILVGGPTRMPVVRERFEKVLGRPAERRATTSAWAASTCPGCRPPRAGAEDRGDVRHRCERNPERIGEGPGDREDREAHDHGPAADGAGEDRPGDSRRGSALRGRPAAPGARRAPEHGGPARVRHGDTTEGARPGASGIYAEVRRGEARESPEGPRLRRRLAPSERD